MIGKECKVKLDLINMLLAIKAKQFRSSPSVNLFAIQI